MQVEFWKGSMLFSVDSNTVNCHIHSMNEMFSAERLAEVVNEWCEKHGITPASGQTGERLSVRNIRYYRALGLLDPPLLGGGHGFSEKHRLQLVAVRLLQAQGLPLSRIQELLFGRPLEDLRRIEKQGLAEIGHTTVTPFRLSTAESWCVTPLNEEFMVVSRRGRSLSQELRDRLTAVLAPQKNKLPGMARGKERKS